jgi:hypothetical protein
MVQEVTVAFITPSFLIEKSNVSAVVWIQAWQDSKDLVAALLEDLKYNAEA